MGPSFQKKEKEWDFSPIPPPHPLIHRSQLEVVVLATGVVDDLDGVLPGVLGGLVGYVPGDLVVDRRSRGFVLLDGLADGLLGVLVEVDDLLQVVVLVLAAAPLSSTQLSSTPRASPSSCMSNGRLSD